MRKGFFFLSLLLLLSAPPVFSQDGLYLSSQDVETIRSELENMRLEVLSLMASQKALRTDSSLLQEKCTALESRLQTALQMLENSEQSVLELSKEAQSLRSQLDELRRLYTELNQSLMKQKRQTRFWMVTAVVSVLAAGIEGIILCSR